jgi:hypothetical protein
VWKLKIRFKINWRLQVSANIEHNTLNRNLKWFPRLEKLWMKENIEKALENNKTLW